MRPQCNLFQCSWCEREFIVDNAISFSGFDVCQPALESGKSVPNHPTHGQINQRFCWWSPPVEKIQFTKLFFVLHRGMSGSQCIVVLVFDYTRSLLLVLQNSLSVTSIVAQFTAWHLGGDGGHGSGVFCWMELSAQFGQVWTALSNLIKFIVVTVLSSICSVA